MYQFYYADHSHKMKRPHYEKKIEDYFIIDDIRPAMWEEHCLECSAPLCFETCPHYIARRDGRCKRFFNGMRVYHSKSGCCGQGMRVQFRQWANMMTILFPTMISLDHYKRMTARNQKLGNTLRAINQSLLPVSLRWNSIRTIEYMRRCNLRKLTGGSNIVDAFIFHGYSFEKETFQLILEIYKASDSVFKTSLMIEPGENLIILDGAKLSVACEEANNLVKVYPENNIEAELDILWCDFVQGEAVVHNENPADKVKCLVWDLDNSLWNGTLIETDTVEKLQLNPGVAEVIEKMDQRGILMSIASKNDYDLAWPVVERLGMDKYMLYPEIHWNTKSSSIKQLAKDLNIGLDSIALIDDSVFERKEVEQNCPSVRTYDISELNLLLSLPEFDVPVTDVSKNRRSMYRAEEKRQTIRKQGDGDVISFLRKCNLTINVFQPNSENDILRSYELIARTNQLNLSGQKYTMDEFEKVLSRTGHKNIAVSCQDDFGSYGIVGFMQYKIVGSEIIFTEYAMSCRVAGKYLESALFTYLLNKESCQLGKFHVIKTKKNVLLRKTLEQIGFKNIEESDEGISYEFSNDLKEPDIVSVIEEITTT